MMMEVSRPPEYARTTFSGMSAPYGQTVFRLLEDDRLFAIHYLVGHFLPAMRRQAVHEHRMGCGFGHNAAIYLVWLKDFCPLCRLVLLPHAGPGVGINCVDACNRSMRVREKLEFCSSLFRNLLRVGNDLRIARVALRSRDTNRRPQTRTGQ